VLQQAGDLGKVKLPVRVREENPIVLRLHDAAFERRAVALVIGMMDSAHLGDVACQRVANLSRRIAAAVVDDDDLPLRGDHGQDLAGRFHSGAEIVLLVECRQHHGERWQPPRVHGAILRRSLWREWIGE